MKLKDTKTDYENCDIYGTADEEVACHAVKLVKCRKQHTCANCGKEIEKGEEALRETGFMDGQPVSCYTCVPCMDSWIEETQGENEERGPQP